MGAWAKPDYVRTPARSHIELRYLGPVLVPEEQNQFQL